MIVRPELGALHWRAALVTGTIWTLGINVVALALGFGAKSLQGVVDDPFFEMVAAAGMTPWTRDVVAVLTRMGNVPQTMALTVVLGVVLAVWMWRSGLRWWIPLVALTVAWVGSRGWQMLQAKLVDRPRDAISLLDTQIGAWPSGGVARVVIVLGSAFVIAAVYGRWSRRQRIGGIAAVTAMGLVEAYCRARLNQHWLTDIVGGFVFGWLWVAVVWHTLLALDPTARSAVGPRAAPSLSDPGD